MSELLPEILGEKIAELRRLLDRGDLKTVRIAVEQMESAFPDNPKVRALRKDLEKREALLNQLDDSGFEISTIKCPSCGNKVNLSQDKALVATCGACGSVLDLKEQGNVLGSVKPGFFSPRSFLKLGLIGLLEGKKYQIIGRLSYKCSIREWDPEDNRYYTEPWTYDEWVLVGENKEYVYLAEDEEGYTLSQGFTPTKPEIPMDGQSMMNLHKGRGNKKILERGSGEVAFFEGEFTWRPTLGDKTSYATYDDMDGTYTVEWRLDPESDQVEEVEFFAERDIERIDLLRAFNLKEELAKEEARIAKEQEWKKWSWGVFAAAGLVLILFFHSCAAGGRNVYETSAQTANIPEEGIVVGPFQLKDRGTVYEMKLESSMPDNSWNWGAVELLDSNQAAVNAIEGDFWRESGRDSDGAWSESDTEQSYLFQVESPGVYYARLFGQKGTARAGRLKFSVNKGIVLSRYYFLAFLFLILFGFVMRRKKSVNPLLIILMIGAAVVFIITHAGDD